MVATLVICYSTQHTNRSLTGTPIAEYVPDTLVKGLIALVGDVAHLPAQLTASGFNASLQDGATLAQCVEKGIQGKAAGDAILEYQSRRLREEH